MSPTAQTSSLAALQRPRTTVPKLSDSSQPSFVRRHMRAPPSPAQALPSSARSAVSMRKFSVVKTCCQVAPSPARTTPSSPQATRKLFDTASTDQSGTPTPLVITPQPLPS